MAYKDGEEIVSEITPTVEIIDRLKPVYNYKANCVYLGAKMNIIDEFRVIKMIEKKYRTARIYKMELSKKDFKLNTKLIK